VATSFQMDWLLRIAGQSLPADSTLYKWKQKEGEASLELAILANRHLRLSLTDQKGNAFQVQSIVPSPVEAPCHIRGACATRSHKHHKLSLSIDGHGAAVDVVTKRRLSIIVDFNTWHGLINFSSDARPGVRFGVGELVCLSKPTTTQEDIQLTQYFKDRKRTLDSWLWFERYAWGDKPSGTKNFNFTYKPNQSPVTFRIIKSSEPCPPDPEAKQDGR
jgi:hypothetical protein